MIKKRGNCLSRFFHPTSIGCSSRLLPILAAILLSGCQSSTGLRPAQELKNYTDFSSRPLLERIVPMPVLLLDDLRQLDNRPDYVPYQPSEKELALVAECLDKVPPSLRTALDTEVIGISFLKGFAGGAMTYDLHGGKVKNWLIFNPATLTASLSQWLTFRDGTAFESSPDWVWKEDASREVAAFQGILIHEAAHVFDFLHRVTPPENWWALPLPSYAHQDGLHFYNFSPEPKLPAEAMTAVFEGLTASGFASVYGSQNNLDEWAELVTYGSLQQFLNIEVTLTLLTPQGAQTYVPTQAPKARDRIAQALSSL